MNWRWKVGDIQGVYDHLYPKSSERGTGLIRRQPIEPNSMCSRVSTLIHDVSVFKVQAVQLGGSLYLKR